eukprot:763623-Hanusia_phi.AAC.4
MASASRRDRSTAASLSENQAGFPRAPAAGGRRPISGPECAASGPSSGKYESGFRSSNASELDLTKFLYYPRQIRASEAGNSGTVCRRRTLRDKLPDDGSNFGTRDSEPLGPGGAQ